MEEEQKKRKTRFYIPNWFSVEIKTGVSPSALCVSVCGFVPGVVQMCSFLI